MVNLLRNRGGSFLAAVLLTAGLAVGHAAPASANSFSVNPTRVFLSAKVRSQVLRLRNLSGETLRFQLSAFGWDQDREGEMQLAPTQDLVFFPALLSLAPGEERSVRIGLTSPSLFGDRERTYRIFVEELPPASRGREPGGFGVKVLTRMGVPIFLAPARPAAAARLEGFRLRAGVLTFALHNSGTVHFVPDAIRLKGVGAASETVFERQIETWYILAGGTRIYELSLPGAVCAQLRTLSVEVAVQDAVLRDALEASAVNCGQ